MSLEEREKSLEKWEKMLHECFSTIISLGDVFDMSPLYKEMKENMVENDAKIREIESKLLEGQKFQHLGCKMEIQTLKSTIVDLQKELQGQATAMMEIPIVPNETK